MPPSFHSSGGDLTASQATTASFDDLTLSEDPTLPALYFTELPLIYLLPQGLTKSEYQDTVSKLKYMQARFARDVNQARLILSFASGAVRAKHDLASERYGNVGELRKPDTGEIATKVISVSDGLDGSTTLGLDPSLVVVVQLRWIFDTIARERIMPLTDYIILQGPWEPRKQKQHVEAAKRRKQNASGEYSPVKRTEYALPINTASQSQSKKRLLLSQETTDDANGVEFRPIPEWVRKQIRFSCQRKQTQPSANEEFVAELRLIKHKRILDDKQEEKIRNSYGRAIASIAAYPYPLILPAEVAKLPNCGEKFEKLFREFQEMGSLAEADEMRNDSRLQTLDIFWKIHGVGPYIAKILYDKGYRSIDSLRYKVWPQLSELFDDNPEERKRIDQLPDHGLDREQQQGLKFYDDFLERIPRAEVEDIAAVIERHLKALTNDKAQVMLVGSYRKGKPTSGDVDVVVSHPDESQTANLVDRIYASLSAEGWIRAKLKISLAHSHRDQTPHLRGHKKAGGFGFAALDIALLVWQDIKWPTKKQDLAEDPNARNPSTCRRVDIIVSPWKSVGCAVLGWSGGITFERDLREYAFKELNWKFDSSGVMNRSTGELIDLEKYNDPSTRARSIQEAEMRVIEGLGLECYDPRERLTD